jgi:hypothetical protein
MASPDPLTFMLYILIAATLMFLLVLPVRFKDTL